MNIGSHGIGFEDARTVCLAARLQKKYRSFVGDFAG
jgi:hypothetical protein